MRLGLDHLFLLVLQPSAVHSIFSATCYWPPFIDPNKGLAGKSA